MRKAYILKVDEFKMRRENLSPLDTHSRPGAAALRVGGLAKTSPTRPRIAIAAMRTSRKNPRQARIAKRAEVLRREESERLCNSAGAC